MMKSRSVLWASVLAFGVLGAWAVPAHAMFKCVDAQGRTTYQQQTCAPTERSQVAPPAAGARATNPGTSAKPTPSAGMTVDEFMRTPTPGLENEPACVKAYDAELSRQWKEGRTGDKRTEADRRKLQDMRAACPQVVTGSSATPDERARQEAQTKAMLARERTKLEGELKVLREACAKAGMPPARGEQGPALSPAQCQQEISRTQAALQRMPR